MLGNCSTLVAATRLDARASSKLEEAASRATLRLAGSTSTSRSAVIAELSAGRDTPACDRLSGWRSPEACGVSNVSRKWYQALTNGHRYATLSERMKLSQYTKQQGISCRTALR